MDVTAQQEALGINEILRSIYGFVLGTNLDTIIEEKQMQMRFVSKHFNECFIAYLKSTRFRIQCGRHVSHIVKWMKSHDIIRLFEFSVCTSGIELQMMNVDFTGLDCSNLSALHLIIMQKFFIYSEEELQKFLSLFSEASSVTQLTLRDDCDNTLSSVVIYKNFLSYFPILKSLDVEFGPNTSANTIDVNRLLEKDSQLEQLVHRSLFGNYTLCSHSLKFLNLSACDLDSICLDCPSLELLVCCNPVDIGITSGFALAEEFGNDEVDFMEKHLELNEMRPSDSNRIASVSSIPSDSIVGTANDFFRVGNDCRIILFTCM